MSINRIAAALAAPAVAAALLTLGVATAQAQPMASKCVAAQSATVSAPSTANALTRAGQLSGVESQARTGTPVSCIAR